MATRHYDECYFVNYDSYDDLVLYEVGCQKCPPDYSFGPIIRNNYVLHYILSGSGSLYLDNREFPVYAEQAFITPPNLVSFYKGSTSDPWNYIWIHFNGRKAMDLLTQAGISKETPVFIPAAPSDGLKDCITEILRHNSEEYTCIGNLYRLFHFLINNSSNRPAPEESDKSLVYIKSVIEYITKKYREPIKIQDIADYCGLDRSYLSKMFKNATSYSPQEYLIFYRIQKAKQLLIKEEIPVQNVAYSIGYTDPFAFSKVFKRETGFSPTQYRSRHTTR